MCIERGHIRSIFNDKVTSSGDSRVNVWSGLTAVHTLWHLYHNVVAKQFSDWFRKYGDGMSEYDIDFYTYEEARRLVAAMIQVVKMMAQLVFTLVKKLY